MCVCVTLVLFHSVHALLNYGHEHPGLSVRITLYKRSDMATMRNMYLTSRLMAKLMNVLHFYRGVSYTEATRARRPVLRFVA